ncbi:MAG: hypothetical protein ACRCSU_06245 [Paracoccaceae bacterium]
MQYDWIIDVLTDLKTFATRNGLPVLAEQLDDVRLIAATEISNVLPPLPHDRLMADRI